MTAESNSVAPEDALPRGLILRGYLIEDVIGCGGFGIVYRARHEDLGGLVAIKEYMPAGLAVRDQHQLVTRSVALREAFDDGLHRFREEARRLIEFQEHPNIVSCRDFFRRNGTAYLVMEYVDGVPLSELMSRREAADRPFEESDLLAVMLPLLEGLAQLHGTGVVHRDVKPSNILVRRDGRPVLIDFGAAKQDFAEHTKSAAPLTDGYAAWEQVGEGRIGPWTDIYAAGAVMWRMVAAGNPPWSPPHPVKVERRANAIIRRQKDPLPTAQEFGAGRFRPQILKCIDKCLEIEHTLRPQTCGDVVRMIEESIAKGSSWNAKTKEEDRNSTLQSVGQANLDIKTQSPVRAWMLGLGLLAMIASVMLMTTSFKPEVDSLPPVAASIPPEPASSLTESESVPPVDTSVPEITAASLPEAGDRWTNGLGIEFTWVLPGNFRMGSASREAESDERPLMEVTISKGFYLGKYEVTQRQWKELMGSNPSHFKDCGEDCPVESVSWADVQTFLRRLNSIGAGESYRLPTEAEWEYAARSGAIGERYAQDIGSIAWYNANSGGRPHPVGLRAPNALGLHDMLGNVCEWVAGWYGTYPGGRVTDPTGPANGSNRVFRGGSWFLSVRYNRISYRGITARGDSRTDLGFRLVRMG